MYVETFAAAGRLTPEIAEELAWVQARHRSQLTVTGNGRTVQMPLLPYCWDVLRVEPGTELTVTAARGRSDDENRSALRDFVTRLHTLTGGSDR